MRARASRRRRGGGADVICLPELFLSPYFLPAHRREPVRSGRNHSRADDRASRPFGPRARQGHCRVALREAHGRRLSQHRRRLRCRRRPVGHLSQDAHPGRPALSRKILFHAGRSRLPRFRHALWPARRPGLLGPVVSGGARLTALQGAQVLIYPTAIGWHPRESGVRGRNTRRG